MRLAVTGPHSTEQDRRQAAALCRHPWVFQTDRLEQGQKLRTRRPLVPATVDGDALTGSVKAGAFGSFPITGTRKG